MRITNGMMQNNMMLNVNRNARQTDSLYNQIGSSKIINLPSDDPIIASRSLRYKASISASEQYQRNNEQAIAWTGTTSTAMSNSIEQLKLVKEALTKGATDSMSLNERKDYATALRASLDEISAQMNTSFGGRYVFSGYRTDEPATYLANTNEAFEIKQSLQYKDLMQVKSYWKADEQTAAEMEEVAGIRLPYGFAENIVLTDNNVVPPALPIDIPVTTKSIDDPTNPYANIGDDDVVYIQETGELLMGKNVQTKLLSGDLDIQYDKTSFLKGELNPKVYFECTELDAAGNYIQKTDQNGDPMWADYPTNTVPVYVSYSMEDQDMMSYELSYKTKIQINSLAKDTLTENLYADLNTSINKVLGMEISTESALKLKYSQAPYSLNGEELDKAIQDQIELETTQVSAIIQDEFSTMLDKIGSHMTDVSREYTNLGARESRLLVIQTRLEEDILNLKTLNSENEDVNYEEAITQLNIVSAIYDASLKITAKISGMSLLNYM